MLQLLERSNRVLLIWRKLLLWNKLLLRNKLIWKKLLLWNKCIFSIVPKKWFSKTITTINWKKTYPFEPTDWFSRLYEYLETNWKMDLPHVFFVNDLLHHLKNKIRINKNQQTAILEWVLSDWQNLNIELKQHFVNPKISIFSLSDIKLILK